MYIIKRKGNNTIQSPLKLELYVLEVYNVEEQKPNEKNEKEILKSLTSFKIDPTEENSNELELKRLMIDIQFMWDQTIGVNLGDYPFKVAIYRNPTIEEANDLQLWIMINFNYHNSACLASGYNRENLVKNT